jgi:putative ABC transport system substrate-binding protein
VELLKNAAPHITKVALLFNPATSPRPIAYIRAAQTAATKWVVQSIEMPVRNDLELERAISAFGAEQDGGLILLPPGTGINLDQLIRLAEQHRLPGMFPDRRIVAR